MSKRRPPTKNSRLAAKLARLIRNVTPCRNECFTFSAARRASSWPLVAYCTSRGPDRPWDAHSSTTRCCRAPGHALPHVQCWHAIGGDARIHGIAVWR